MKKPITPCLWFDDQAEEAAGFYISLFKNSGIINISRYGKEGFEVHGKPEGTALTVEFSLGGQLFNGLNGGFQFKFNPSISFQVFCDSQEAIDYFWDKLSEGGSEGRCGWLKDKYGVSWQVVPSNLGELMGNPEKSGKVMEAFLKMTKFDLNVLLSI